MHIIAYGQRVLNYAKVLQNTELDVSEIRGLGTKGIQLSDQWPSPGLNLITGHIELPDI